MLGASFARGILVESVGAQAEAARRTFAENGMTHLTAETAAAEEFLARPSERPDCCIVDPPRPGLTRLVREAIGRIRPRTILYVSCDPSTQARDAGFLVNRSDRFMRVLCGYFPGSHRGAMRQLHSAFPSLPATGHRGRSR
jgi:23S rRNA (uracil1939-C5)-methyltransferase